MEVEELKGSINGPKNLPARLSAVKQSLVFADGNTWTKNFYKYEDLPSHDGGVESGGDIERFRRLPCGAQKWTRYCTGIVWYDSSSKAPPTPIDGAIGSLFAIPTCSITFSPSVSLNVGELLELGGGLCTHLVGSKMLRLLDVASGPKYC